MPAKKTSRTRAARPKVETFETASTVVGEAFIMPDDSLLLAEAEAVPIDFQARQDSISEKRRGPDAQHQRKTRTRAKPSPAKETKI